MEAANIEKEIAELEKTIAEQKIMFAGIILDTAKARKNYTKHLYKYIDSVNNQKPQEEINQAEENYLGLKVTITQKEEEHYRMAHSIMREENKFADLENSHLTVLAERNKIIFVDVKSNKIQ